MNREELTAAARASISYVESLAEGRRSRDLPKLAKHDGVNPFEVRRRLNAALQAYYRETGVMARCR